MMTYAGSINEPGYVAGMNKKGFNGPRALGELTANSLDAKASLITFDITKEIISIVDNGKGMTMEQLVNMWDAQRQNHSDDISTGVSGFGAKPSTKILSKNTTAEVYTKSSNEGYYKAFIPWNKIVKEGKWTGMVTISEMKPKEIDYFKKILNECTGTIIKFPYNTFLENEIIKQFHNPETIKESNQRLDCVFSNFTHTNIRCNHYESNEPKQLLMYSYFNDDMVNYYKQNRYNITIFRDSSNREVYVLPDGSGYQSFQLDGRGWRLKDWIGHRCAKKVGTIEILCGMRKDDAYFNYSNPKEPTGEKQILSYEKEFFDNNDDIKTDLWYPSLYRNNQYIGNIRPLPNFKPTSARASGSCCLKLYRIRTSINYEVNSSQDNEIDELMGIQENKNQLNTGHIDESFKRLIEHCMKDTSEDIWDHFTQVINKEHDRIELIRKKELEKEMNEMIRKKRILDTVKNVAKKWLSLIDKDDEGEEGDECHEGKEGGEGGEGEEGDEEIDNKEKIDNLSDKDNVADTYDTDDIDDTDDTGDYTDYNEGEGGEESEGEDDEELHKPYIMNYSGSRKDFLDKLKDELTDEEKKYICEF